MLGAYNFRPLAGRTRTRPPVVFRSGQLLLSTASARRRMARASISLVIDLRSPATARAFPDRPVPGAAYVNIDVIGGDDAADVAGSALMAARYRLLVEHPGQRARLAEVLRRVADHEGGVLVHCTDGKDRTGWVAALLQHVAGDDARAVQEAYLASNRAIRAMVGARLVADLVRRGPAYAWERQPVNVVRAAYLDAALGAVTQRWGDLDAYLTEGLRLDAATLTRLRDKVA